MSGLTMTPPPLSAQAMADLLCTLLVCCRGKRANGRPYCAYLCIKPSMAASFKEAREKGSFSLEDYGTILEWGEGEDVPADVQARMAQEYGATEDQERQIARAIHEYRQANG